MTQTGHRLAGVWVNARRRPRVGLALSGGARGLAHIGVPKVLEREALVEGRSATVFAVKLLVPNPDLKLKPGMPADVVFP